MPAGAGSSLCVLFVCRFVVVPCLALCCIVLCYTWCCFVRGVVSSLLFICRPKSLYFFFNAVYVTYEVVGTHGSFWHLYHYARPRQMGKVVADETEKGWYIQWVDRDPRLLAMQEAAARREKADLDDEEKQASGDRQN